eukprot:6471363-Amphidinium_carterae.1
MTDNHSLPLALERMWQLLLPQIPFQRSLLQAPSKSTITRSVLATDTSLMLWWQTEWERLLSNEHDFGIHYMADSSPQFGKDWLLQEIRVVAHQEAAACLARTVVQTALDLEMRGVQTDSMAEA